ncbi:MAG: sulfite exporter TauE/SafE family protein [Phycisphaerae bacterium]|nr:sulfite exporter TauE/SafE family protein [Phycisphaerae bacterium]
MQDFVVLPALFLAAAVLYSAVGHGGASAYLSVMAFAGMAPAIMRPTALLLNILVAGIATVRFVRSGAFSWPLFLLFAAGSVPAALLGGWIHIPALIYKQIVGVILLYAAARLIIHPRRREDASVHRPNRALAVGLGAAIGFLSGLVGVGGGIFLSPLLILMGWAETRVVCGISAAFIVVNSLAGLVGVWTSGAPAMPPAALVWAIAVVVGGVVGTSLGTRVLSITALRRWLGVVLVVAGAKLLLTQ